MLEFEYSTACIIRRADLSCRVVHHNLAVSKCSSSNNTNIWNPVAQDSIAEGHRTILDWVRALVSCIFACVVLLLARGYT